LKLPRLKEVRELHGWSQAKLAEESDVSRDSISNYETGQREAWPATAKKLADALHVEIADLREPVRELATSGKVEAPREAGPLDQGQSLMLVEVLANARKVAQPLIEQDDQTIAAYRQALARMKGGIGVSDAHFVDENSEHPELEAEAAEIVDFALAQEQRQREKARSG
jgi:transcriptional regulator with XRE-family HTH domain